MKKRYGNQPIKCEDVAEVGDIFCYSWGYDQTNVDWFQVISLTKSGKSAKFQKLKSVKVPKFGMMSGTTTPDMNNFVEGSQPFTKRFEESSYGDMITRMDHGSMVKWDGKSKHYSTWA